jgi:hypothetical protein
VVPKMCSGLVRGGHPPKNRNFFFFSESFYLVATRVGGAENV